MSFINKISVAISLVLFQVSALFIGATGKGEGNPTISEHDAIIEKSSFYLRLQKGFLSVDINDVPLEESLYS